MHATLRVTLLGPFSASLDARPLERDYARRAQELFCYLLLHPEQAHGREKLASTLWGDACTTTQSRTYLRKALWQLQTKLTDVLGDDVSNLIDAAPATIRLAPAHVWTDAGVVEAAYRSTEGTPGDHLTSEAAETVERAVDLYQGDLLEDWYQEWCLVERERFYYFYHTLLDKLVDHCTAQGRYDAGLRYAQSLLRTDRARERTHRQIMRLHYARGDRTSALRQYEQCAMALRDELGVPPGGLTNDLAERIRADVSLRPPSERNAVARHELLTIRKRLRALQDHIEHLAHVSKHPPGTDKEPPQDGTGTPQDTASL